MSLKFTKMHALGNDFMVIDAVRQSFHLTPKDIARLADRHTGIGFDQCLVIEPAKNPTTDFFYRIFNADGFEVGQCGNGARCLALFAMHSGLTTKNQLKVATNTTQMELKINPDESVTVCLGVPRLLPEEIPFLTEKKQPAYPISLKGDDPVSIHAINVGNPHAVLIVDDITKAPVTSLGPQISKHPQFPEHCNVGFMELINSNHIKLRVYERGCGETQACGSGAVAAAAIGRLFYQLEPQITVRLLGWELKINWEKANDPIYLTGPGTFVFEGVID